MTDALPTAFQERGAFIRVALAPLSHRRRLAVAVAALERCFEVIASCPLDVAPAETAWELARLAALGEALSVDEAKWAMQAVDDAEDEAAHDLSGVEHAVARVVWYLADAVKDPAGDLEAVAAVLEALLEGVEAATSDDHDADDRLEFAWIAALLEAAAPPNVEVDADVLALGRGAAPRWVVRAGTGVRYHDPDPADLEDRRLALLSARPATAAARAVRVARRRATPVVPFRASHGIPERYTVREVGRGAAADEGKIAVSGARHYGLFASGDDADDAPSLFAPPESVALGMTADETTLVSWRVTRRAGLSGIARGHHRWTLEVYSWPAMTLMASHIVGVQEVIDWCTPVDLEVPARDDGNLVVVLRATSEDFSRRVELLRGDDGSFTETVT